MLQHQIALSLPTKKRLWQQLVACKLQNQSRVLSLIHGNTSHPAAARLLRLSQNVSSGDKENLEAQGARLYWQALPAGTFQRSGHEGWLNAVLNYTYAIFRSQLAKWVCAAGLHPTLGLHHQNDLNPFNLVDDLIEPFRPLADWHVWQWANQQDSDWDTLHEKALDTADKSYCLTATQQACWVGEELTTISLAMRDLVEGVSRSIKQQAPHPLQLPSPHAE